LPTQTDVSVIAHRGAWGRHRENTLEAFVEARRLGADGVELDVRASADGALVVHHDAEIPGVGSVARLRVAELPPWVPLVAAALEACAGMTSVLEIKNLPTEPDWDPSEAVATSLAALVGGREADDVVVSSFSLATLGAVHSADPALATAWLTLPGFDQSQALRTVVERGHRQLHPHHRGVNAALVEEAHGAGVAVTTWTVDDPARMGELAGMGVDAIITNVPDVALSVLGRA
jgi:glycerophosphoryl diester phosphodiesterase